MTTYEDFLQTRDAKRIYLVELQPYNKDTASLEWLYFSEVGFKTEPSDTPSNTLFTKRVNRAFSYQVNLYGEGKVGGRSVPGFGTIELQNVDGGLDYLRPENYAFDGRRCVVRLGGIVDGVQMAYGDFGVIFDGTVEAIEFGDQLVTVRLRDPQHKIDVPLQSALYGGTGGADGTVELAGTPKPCLYGQVFNFEPVLVDPVLMIYQLHYQDIHSIQKVKDQGVQITAGVNRGSYAGLVGTAPTAGQFDYVQSSAGSYVRLGSTPNGLVTVDAKGDDSGSGYVDSVAGIIERIVTGPGGLSASDLDGATFTALNSANPATVGFYTRDPINIPDVLDLLVNSIGAYFTFSRSGKLQVGRIEQPSGTPVEVYSDDFGFTRLPTVVPTWRLAIGYQKNHRPMSDADLATSFRPGGVNAASAPALKTSMLYSSTSDAAVKTAHLLALDLKVDTQLALLADATAEATRQLNLFKVVRDLYRVRVKSLPFARNLGEVVQLTLDRYGLEAGKLFTIIGMSENSDTSIVELDLWG